MIDPRDGLGDFEFMMIAKGGLGSDTPAHANTYIDGPGLGSWAIANRPIRSASATCSRQCRASPMPPEPSHTQALATIGWSKQGVAKASTG